MTYWVYENWQEKHASIHKATCGLCNDGQGCHNTSNQENGRWFGPYETYNLALHEAQTFVHNNNCENDLKICNQCNPNVE